MKRKLYFVYLACCTVFFIVCLFLSISPLLVLAIAAGLLLLWFGIGNGVFTTADQQRVNFAIDKTVKKESWMRMSGKRLLLLEAPLVLLIALQLLIWRLSV